MEQEHMIQKKIDKLIKEHANGPHNIKRWTVPINSSDKRDNAKHKIIK